jgi:hypothetical protein
VRITGNPRKILECTITERNRLSELQRFAPNRELTVIFPTKGESDSAFIALDEIECQVIKGGSHLIDKLSRVYGDFRIGIGEVDLARVKRIP